jgi:ABC-type sulfate transport system substrate-binding protein
MQQMIQEGPSRYDCLMVYENLVIENVRNAELRWGELHVVYPARSMWNDNPYYILETQQSSDEQRAAATEFLAFLLSEPVQRQAIEHGFRPANVKVPIRFPESPFVQLEANGISLAIPQACDPPSAEVLKGLLDTVQTINK